MIEAQTDAQYAALDQAHDDFVSYMEQINDLTGDDREAALIDWMRCGAWHPTLMICEGWQGALAKEAYLVTRGGPIAQSWCRAPYDSGRAAILRALRIGANEPGASYAADVFRIVQDDGSPWIAGAVGGPASLNPDRRREWLPIDITDVILWNPRTNDVHVMGEAKSQPTITMPYPTPDNLTVYADPFAFFRAWAERRAVTWGQFVASHAKKWAHGVNESLDGGLPGALVVGDLNKIAWRDLSPQTLTAGPGIDRDALNRAVFRTARLPRVIAAPSLSIAA